MNLPNDKFCVLPWISLETSPIGTVRPCCLAKDEIVDENNKKFKVIDASLVDIQNSAHMDKLRQDFLDGKKPDTCQRCWSVEDAGGTSKRMHTLDRLKDILANETTWTIEPKELKFLDLKLGNICNLACRICGSWSSSTYASEELKQLKYDARKDSYARIMIKEGAWPRANESRFWDELDFHADEIRYLEFTGGEPFMIKEHFELLQKLVDRNLAQHIEIHYNTNGTIYPDEWVDVWKQFKHVEVAFSIDDLGKRFEYQRHGANWDEVMINLNKFIELKNNASNISLQICTTVNIFNIYYLEEIAQFLASIKDDFDFIYWNMLHDAPVHSIRSFSREAKDILRDRLQNANVIDEFKKEFESIIKFMNEPSAVTVHVLQKNIQTLDERKGESMFDVMPELYRIIFPYG